MRGVIELLVQSCAMMKLDHVEQMITVALEAERESQINLRLLRELDDLQKAPEMNGPIERRSG